MIFGDYMTLIRNFGKMPILQNLYEGISALAC